MLRIAVAMLALVLLVCWTGDVGAVEKKDKDKKTVVKKVPKPKPAVKAKLIAPRDSASKAKAKTGQAPKYDRFVDKNKNGIDDRKEKLVPKSQVKAKKTDKKTTKKK